MLIPSHATLRKFRSAGLEAVKRTRLSVCFRDILRLYSPFLVADASARQRAKYNQQQRLRHGTTLPLTQSIDVSAIFVSEMWIHELKISSTHDFAQGSFSIVRGVENLRARAARPEEAAQLGLRNDEDRVVMSVRRQTFAADGAILDVVDAVYDARRYAYEAEMARSGLGLTWPRFADVNGEAPCVEPGF